MMSIHRTVSFSEPAHELLSQLRGHFGVILPVEQTDRQDGTGYSPTYLSRHEARWKPTAMWGMQPQSCPVALLTARRTDSAQPWFSKCFSVYLMVVSIGISPERITSTPFLEG
jgi:hypothetical protein